MLFPIVLLVVAAIVLAICYVWADKSEAPPAGSPVGTPGHVSYEMLRLTFVLLATVLATAVLLEWDWFVSTGKTLDARMAGHTAPTPDGKPLPNGPDAIIAGGKIQITSDPPIGMDYVNIIPITAAGEGDGIVMSGKEFDVPPGATKLQLQWQDFHATKYSLRKNYDVP